MKPEKIEMELVEHFEVVYRCEDCYETFDDKNEATEHWKQDHEEEDEE